MTSEPAPHDQSAIRSQVKQMIVANLRFEGLTVGDIADDAPLFGEGLGLDSVDALELVVAMEQQFGIRIQSHEVDKSAFASVAHLAEFVSRTLAATTKPGE